MTAKQTAALAKYEANKARFEAAGDSPDRAKLKAYEILVGRPVRYRQSRKAVQV